MVVIFLLISAVFGQFSLNFSYESDYSVTNNNGAWNARVVEFFVAGNIVSYTSASATVAGQTANVYDISGTVIAFSGTVPNAYLSAGDYTVGGTGSISGDSAFIGNSYHDLTEMDPQGNTVQVIGLDSLTWTAPTTASTSGSLSYATLSGTDGTSFVVNLTPITSTTLGTINTGAVVSPNALEIDIQILNFPFKSTSNTLQLSMGVLTGSTSLAGQVSTVGNWHVLGAGSGASQVYFTTATKATANTETVNVNVTVGAASGNTLSDLYSGQLSLSLTISQKWVNVTFPYSLNINYDPSAGAGPNPVDNGKSSDASKPLFGILTALFVIFTTLFNL